MKISILLISFLMIGLHVQSQPLSWEEMKAIEAAAEKAHPYVPHSKSNKILSLEDKMKSVPMDTLNKLKIKYIKKVVTPTTTP